MLKRNSIIIAILSIFACNMAIGQMKSSMSNDMEKLFKDNLESSLNSDKILSSEQSAVGDIIEPDYYYLGPGDILSYINFSESSKQQFLTVTPEMTVYVPRAGEVSVKGMTLSQAKLTMLAKIKEIQSQAIINLSIYKPRKVLFSVTGNFIYEGNYSLPASFRVSTALSAIENMAKQNEKQVAIQYNLERSAERVRKMKQQFEGSGMGANMQYNSRNIIISRRDGRSEYVDIEKSKVTGNVALNPYIQENDKIILPYPNNNDTYINVSGAVNFPTQIPFRKGDKVSELIKMAGGFSADVDLDNIKIIGNDNSIKSISYNENEQKFSDDEIQPGSGIVAGSKESVQAGITSKSSFVSVQGEVKKPGIYQIKEGTRIKEVIELAGGFTTEAYLPLANVLRPDKHIEASKFNDDYQNFFRTSDLTMDDSTRTRNILTYSLPLVSCSIADLYVNNSEDDNVLLKGGDIIRIPKNPKTVYISGYINKPGYIDFEPGKNMEWYIAKAGGISSGGVKNRARIVRGNTQVWSEGDSKEFVYAGDQIYVPAHPDYPAGTDIQKYSLIISAVFAALSMASFIMQILNYMWDRQKYNNAQK